MKKPQWLRDIRRFLQYLHVAFSDAWRYLLYSSVFVSRGASSALESKLTILAHKLEKGMALPEPRLGFGRETIKELMQTHQLLEVRSSESAALQFSLGVLRAYSESEHISSLDVDLASRINAFIRERETEPASGGLVSLTRTEGLTSIPGNVEDFFFSRHSVREFASEPISEEEIMSAVRLAQRSPSVCNRQPWNVYIVQSEEQKGEILRFQNGNRGFGHSAGAVLVVTVPLSAFHGPLERNEAFVDGGMFSMSLIWALHAKGLGSCALNWCATTKRDKGVRASLGIPNAEVIIMMIAVGHLKERFDVAMSPRRPIESMVTVSSDRGDDFGAKQGSPVG